ncbi:heavy metal translocating P-type ATPase [Mesorhizobium qingshengii]|uniref:P-type Zn(2+) transporter n=1 Tax=Mesorhizobium qingshengii TaxID=1165689 RepID=A0ABT4R2T2_9HYPH|nr:heavy metal translocating P-type ATPase [Mesorhizobium qingshengii]MCZ8548142.1 heavy metal translocating P-type ATPase [Mesorhizobium qingshengii]
MNVRAEPLAAQSPAETAHEHDSAKDGLLGGRAELVASLSCGLALAAGWLTEGYVPAEATLWLYGLAYALGGFFTLREAVVSLWHGRFDIDTLMLVAAAGAAALGQWAEGALLLFLFSLGHSLEHYAMGRASGAIHALGQLAPKLATRRTGGTLEQVSVNALQVGDIVVVRPNERLPADGIVIAGRSSVDQAPITGESMPADKRPIDSSDQNPDFSRIADEHRVFAGSINGAGSLDIKVAKLAGETTLARVVRMVAEAEAQRSPTQRFTDRFARIFVPAVLVSVGALMLAFLVLDEPFGNSFYRAMAVLVAASPCALAISVPSAVLSGVARAARGGVLVKGGGPLENLGSLAVLAFDKTGTLTEGKPRLTDVMPAPGIDEKLLLGIAVAIERGSDHPLAAAVVRDGIERLGEAEIKTATSIESLNGSGVRGMVDKKVAILGKPRFFATEYVATVPASVTDMAAELEKAGRTVIMVRYGKTYLGVLGLMDTPRAGAREVISRLRTLGIRRIVMLSGDNQSVADNVARDLGVDEARGGLMPEDKAGIVKALLAQEGKVAMIGDGVNDAPAMANATVGIAMGAAGSDVALEAADVALMADDLGHLPFVLGLSRRTGAVIRQNLWISLGMVALLVPAALFGLPIGAAVVFHEGSTVLVVLNALRLLAYAAPRDIQAAA